MQQETSEVQSEDKKSLSDKNKKRRFKTPDQVVALENFYNEHKYPSEELKTQFAASLGLTEKQISGWFCHRRLKDKRLLSGDASGNGKQDRSSGIIVPDHGSGHKQDSCGSTKEGGPRPFDHREVQSRGLSGKDLQFADLAYKHGRHHEGKTSDLDDTSSETENVARTTNLMGIRPRQGPAGYLKLKGRVENPAIASVKRQLGKDYQEDGPPLGLEFDQIPPGAFESSMNNAADEPHYPDIPPEVLRSLNKPEVVTSCDVYNAGMSSGDPHSDGSNFRVKPPSHCHDNVTCLQTTQRPVFSNNYTSMSKRNSSTEFTDEFSSEMPVYDRRPNAQHDFHRKKDEFINSRQRGSFPYKSEDVSLEQVQRQQFESKYSNIPSKLSNPSDMDNRGLSKRISKNENFVKERMAINESSVSTRVQHGKRVWEDFQEQTCRRTAFKAESPLQTYHTKRSAAAEMPSSSSEDETEVTSSSED